MTRRTEDWPLSRNGARRVPGWDDTDSPPPDRTPWGFVVGIMLGVALWIAAGVALRVWGWL